MRTVALILLAAVGLLTGCVTRQPFTYNYPPKSNVTGSASLAALPATDRRAGTNELDKVLFIPSGLDEIFIREIRSTGKFADVVRVNPLAPGKDFLLEASLLQLDWEIPKHDQMVGTAFGVSLLTGGVGGIIYGSTKTTIFGRAQIAFKVSNPVNNRIILEKQYSSEVSERVAKLNCDTPAAGRRLAGLAVKAVMDQFKQDLNKTPLDQ